MWWKFALTLALFATIAMAVLSARKARHQIDIAH
jgi:hypothetical protein